MSVTLSSFRAVITQRSGIAPRTCLSNVRRCVSREHVISAVDDDDEDEKELEEEDGDDTAGIEPLTVEDDDFFDENDFDDDFDDDFEEEYEELEADFKNDDDEKIPVKEKIEEEDIELEEGDF